MFTFFIITFRNKNVNIIYLIDKIVGVFYLTNKAKNHKLYGLKAGYAAETCQGRGTWSKSGNSGFFIKDNGNSQVQRNAQLPPYILNLPSGHSHSIVNNKKVFIIIIYIRHA